MAYCVHCGVKLGKGENACPLCGIPAQDPLETSPKAAARAYPVRLPEQELKYSRRFTCGLCALLTLGPAVLCLILDALLGQGLTWSPYAFGALALVFLTVTLPMLFPSHRSYASIITCFFTLSAYLFMVERLSLSGTWFFPIVLPCLAICAALALSLCWLQGARKKTALFLTATAFMDASVLCVAVELFYSLEKRGCCAFLWSPFAFAPCVFLALLFYFINGNRALRNELKKRLFF